MLACTETSVHACAEPRDHAWVSAPRVTTLYAICIQHMASRNRGEHSMTLRRASTRQWTLKPQDLAVALKIVALKDIRPSYAALAKHLRLSPFEAHAAVQRLLSARLAVDRDGIIRPLMASLRSFVINGAQYAYPAVRGEITRGFPTAHASLPLRELIHVPSDSMLVWPHPEGTARGEALLPLYEKLPMAANDDVVLYELLALFDALRVGRARERALARQFLEERLQ